MSRVLIVSKTRMRGDHVCVGGHNLDESMRSIRLLQADGTNMSAGTGFEIGQVWDLDYEPATDIRPPHVEDVFVKSHGARHVDTIQSLGAPGASVGTFQCTRWPVSADIGLVRGVIPPQAA
jgi:hypothetical protein